MFYFSLLLMLRLEKAIRKLMGQLDEFRIETMQHWGSDQLNKSFTHSLALTTLTTLLGTPSSKMH